VRAQPVSDEDHNAVPSSLADNSLTAREERGGNHQHGGKDSTEYREEAFENESKSRLNLP
jgi:hypothetical protein